MQGRRRWLSILIVASMATIGFGLSAGADPATETDFLTQINAERTSRGLGALAVDIGLRSYARAHTQDMMDANQIYHSTSAELRSAGGSGWSKLGENVGRGGTVSSLHAAFMDSPGHKANILGEYNYVGIGTGSRDGVLYVTVVFMQKAGPAQTTTTTAPPPTTTTTTTAPAPTTTIAPAETTTTVQQTTTTAEAAAAPTQPDQEADPIAPTTTTTTIPDTTTTTLIVGPDKPITPGESCLEATRFWWMCHD